MNMTQQLASALRTATRWEREQLADDNKGRMPELQLPEVPWLGEAEAALLTYDATCGWRAGCNIPGSASECVSDRRPDFASACRVLCSFLQAEAKRCKEASAQCGGEKMIALNQRGAACDEAVSQVEKRLQCAGASPLTTEPFWFAIGNHAWWVARDQPQG